MLSISDQCTAGSDGADTRSLTDLLQQCTFGHVISRLRSSRGITQESLASSSRLSVAFISRIEDETRLPPARPAALRIGAALGLDRDDAQMLANLGLKERLPTGQEAEFPRDVRQLLDDVRRLASALPPTYVLYLVTQTREREFAPENYSDSADITKVEDEKFSEEVRQFLEEIRLNAYSLRPRFIRRLRAAIREAVRK